MKLFVGILGLTLLPMLASAGVLKCHSAEFGPELNYMVTFSADRSTAEVHHQNVGDRASLTCKPVSQKATSQDSLFCFEVDGEGMDNPFSIELSVNKTTQRMTGTLNANSSAESHPVVIANLTCTQR